MLQRGRIRVLSEQCFDRAARLRSVSFEHTMLVLTILALCCGAVVDGKIRPDDDLAGIAIVRIVLENGEGTVDRRRSIAAPDRIARQHPRDFAAQFGDLIS